MTVRSWLITLCGLVSTVTAGLFVLAPVETQTSVYSWPDTQGRNTALPLFPYKPHHLEVAFPCTDVHEVGEGSLLSTTAPRDELDESGHDGLTIDIAGNTVDVAVGDHRIATSSVGQDCEWSVVADETGTTVAVDGETIASTEDTPVVTGMFTEAPKNSGLRVTVVPDTRYESSPSPLRIALAAVTVAALTTMFVLLVRTRNDNDEVRRVRVLPRRWWRPHAPDAVVGAILANWLVVGAPTVDDGYIVTMLKAAESGDFIGNYFRWFNAPEAPFSWFYELYRPLVEVSGATWWLRLPSVLLGLVLWLLIDRLLLPRLVRRPTSLARFGAAAVFALWYVQFGVGLRPEPWVMLGTVVVFLLLERAVVTRSPATLGASVVAAGLTVAVTPTGIVALAPFLAAAPDLVRLVRHHGAVVVPVVFGAGAVTLLPMFADQSLAAVLHSTEVRTAIGPSYGVWDEPRRYADLFEPMRSGLNRRMPLLLLWLSMLVLAVLLVTRRARGLAVRPTRRGLVIAVLFFVALAFTPTKYTHHFGAIGGIATVLVAAVVHTIDEGALRRSWQRSLFTLALAAVTAYALAAPVRWWFVAGLGVPWSLGPPELGGLALSDIVLVGGTLLALAGLVGAWRLLPSPAWLLPLVATGTVLLEVVSLAYPALTSRSSTYSVAHATAAGFSDSCGIEDWLEVEPDRSAGLLAPAPGAEGVRAHGFSPDTGYPDDATPPAPYGTDKAPVWGSGGSAGSLTTPWYALPDDAGAPDSPPLVVPLAGAGAVSATVQFGDRDGTVQRELRLRLGDGTWREARLEPGDAERVRVTAVDRRNGDGWIAVGAPRIPRVVPLTEYLPVSEPVGLDWVNAFFLSCRQPASVAHGVTQPVSHLLSSGPDSSWLTGMSYSAGSGGPYAPLLDIAERVPVPTYLRGDKLREPISVFRLDYVAPPLEGVSQQRAHR